MAVAPAEERDGRSEHGRPWRRCRRGRGGRRRCGRRCRFGAGLGARISARWGPTRIGCMDHARATAEARTRHDEHDEEGSD